LRLAVDVTLARVALGKTGEDLACRELERRGYAILARRYRRRGGELDIVARDGGTIVFVEVKARRGQDWGGGADAVTPLKQRKIVQIAMEYLVRHRLMHHPCRFDVVAIDMAPSEPAIEVYRNAFLAAD
jgi:putative endonuclease